MASVHEDLSRRFAAWEIEGRGWRTHPFPVRPEPLFKRNDYPDGAISHDDGRRPTVVSSIVSGLRSRLLGKADSKPSEQDSALPVRLERTQPVELTLLGSKGFSPSRDSFGRLISTLGLCAEPASFEFISCGGKIRTQITIAPQDLGAVRPQLAGFYPELTVQESNGFLNSLFQERPGNQILTVDFGLSQEFFITLEASKQEPFTPLLSALSTVQHGEVCVYQVLFEQVTNGWADAIMASVTYPDGKPLFINAPEYISAATKKTSSELYAVVVRVLFAASTYSRLLELAKQVASAMRVFNSASGNALVPLDNDRYDVDDHLEDVVLRQTRRSGMILNLEELTQFAHVPSDEVPASLLERQTIKTKRAPSAVIGTRGLCLGINTHASEAVSVSLTPEHRVRHCHIIGSSGTGKSTLLFNFIKQDIENGQGVAVLDPHGDLVDKVLSVIPPSRLNEVILIDPSDEVYSTPFNILSAHTEHEKTLLASDLVAVFQRLSTSWGDQMHSVLQNAILAFLSSTRGGTLADLRRFLIEPGFRAEFLSSVDDPNLLYYWQKGFPNLGGNRSIGPILTRLEMFLAQRPIAHMVCQPKNRLDFGEIMDSGKILLAKLSEGLLGRENCYLLGALLVSKFQQLAMARQAKRIESRRDYWIYIDEFANFITPSMAEILSGARKYRIGLTLAHHTLQQLQRTPDVAAAVMSHPQTRIVFRVSDEDARKLSEGFSFFDADDFKNLEVGQAIVRIERSSFDFNLEVTPPISTEDSEAWRQTVIAASQRTYGTPRHEVDAFLRQSIAHPETSKSVSAHKAPLERIIKEPNVTTQAPEAPQAPVVPTTAQSEPPGPSAIASSPITLPRALPKPEPSTAAPPLIQPVSRPSTRPVPEGLGKGGAQHRAIQSRVKEEAEKLGFRVVVESPISGSNETIDLLLERGVDEIACEISISTTIDHEVHNASKCLKAGRNEVAIVSSDPKRLKKIEKAVVTSLGSQLASKVKYFEPDTFIAYLVSLSSKPRGPEYRRGYKISRSVAEVSPDEQKARERALIQEIADSMQTKKQGKIE